MRLLLVLGVAVPATIAACRMACWTRGNIPCAKLAGWCAGGCAFVFVLVDVGEVCEWVGNRAAAAAATSARSSNRKLEDDRATGRRGTVVAVVVVVFV